MSGGGRGTRSASLAVEAGHTLPTSLAHLLVYEQALKGDIDAIKEGEDLVGRRERELSERGQCGELRLRGLRLIIQRGNPHASVLHADSAARAFVTCQRPRG